MLVYLILVFFSIAVCSCALKTKTCTWSALSARRVVRPSRTRATTTSTPSCTATFTLSWLHAKIRLRPTSSRSPCLRMYSSKFVIHHTTFASMYRYMYSKPDEPKSTVFCSGSRVPSNTYSTPLPPLATNNYTNGSSSLFSVSTF